MIKPQESIAAVSDFPLTTQFLLASRLASYPSQENRQDLLLLLPGLEQSQPALASVSSVISEIKLYRELPARYIQLFDIGNRETSLYETDYGLGRLQIKTTELADICGFYQAFGFRLSAEDIAAEMADHLAVECEFYALLLAKQQYFVEQGEVEGQVVVLEAQKKFLCSHLGRYPEAVAKSKAVLADPFYSIALEWCAKLVAQEIRRLNVDVLTVSELAEELDGGEIKCGGSEIVAQIGMR